MKSAKKEVLCTDAFQGNNYKDLHSFTGARETIAAVGGSSSSSSSRSSSRHLVSSLLYSVVLPLFSCSIYSCFLEGRAGR